MLYEGYFELVKHIMYTLLVMVQLNQSVYTLPTVKTLYIYR